MVKDGRRHRPNPTKSDLMTEENKQLLSEGMETLEQITERATMECRNVVSSTKREGFIEGIIAEAARNEQARTKDRELIQTLVGELIQSRASILGWIPDELTPMAHQMKIALKRINSALALAGERGYQPTEK